MVWELYLKGSNAGAVPSQQDSRASPGCWQLTVMCVIRCAADKRTDNCRRQYDQIAMPDGLCVIGDAVAAFNPVYGQVLL